MSAIVLDSPSGYLTLQFLAWLAERPRSYGEAMDAWRTSCPRLSIWEDAMGEGLIELGEGRWRDRHVRVTAKGRALLQAAPRCRRRRSRTKRFHLLQPASARSFHRAYARLRGHERMEPAEREP